MIYDKNNIIEGLKESFGQVATLIREADASELEKSSPGKWCASDHFRHLILSTKPVVGSLKMSQEDLLKVCQPKHPSRTYDQLVQDYESMLVKRNGKTTATYEPVHLKEATTQELLTSWDALLSKGIDRLSTWSEERLEINGLPHPAMGALTMREMMCFTILHARRHLKSMKQMMAVVA